MSANVFDERWMEYDAWYDKHRDAFLKELKLIRRNLPAGAGLEVGVGTGRFAKNLENVVAGVDVSLNMLRLAKKREVEVILSDASNLPFKRVFDFVLFAFTICFVEDPLKALREASKVLKPGGKVVVCFVPEGELVEEYRKKNSPFYRNARFYSIEEISELLKKAGFSVEKVDFTDLKYGRDVALVIGKIDEKPLNFYPERN